MRGLIEYDLRTLQGPWFSVAIMVAVTCVIEEYWFSVKSYVNLMPQ
jgi:hypothetical protein